MTFPHNVDFPCSDAWHAVGFRFVWLQVRRPCLYWGTGPVSMLWKIFPQAQPIAGVTPTAPTKTRSRCKTRWGHSVWSGRLPLSCAALCDRRRADRPRPAVKVECRLLHSRQAVAAQPVGHRCCCWTRCGIDDFLRIDDSIRSCRPAWWALAHDHSIVRASMQAL